MESTSGNSRFSGSDWILLDTESIYSTVFWKAVEEEEKRRKEAAKWRLSNYVALAHSIWPLSKSFGSQGRR